MAFVNINVQICGNDRLMITAVVAKWPGSVYDSRILNTSTLFKRFNRQVLPCLPNGVILGRISSNDSSRKTISQGLKTCKLRYRKNIRHPKETLGLSK